jgi:hypothetical protein
MKELIIEALNIAFERVKARAPQKKDKTITLGIHGLTPCEVAKLLLEENVPEYAEFDWDDQVITWISKVNPTDRETQTYIECEFSRIAWDEIHLALIREHYQRVNHTMSTLNHWISFATYRNPMIYDLYIKRDWDTLVHFYSVVFVNPSDTNPSDVKLNNVKPSSSDERSFRRGPTF